MKRIALVTGATSGIGMETAKHLAENGYIVYGSARRIERLNDLKSSGVIPIHMDVTDDASMIKGIQQIINEQSRIDILVNNAGFGSYGAVEDVPLHDAKYQLEVNVFGAARLIQLVLPHMRKQQYGKIVNITSIGGKVATPLGGWYHASKFALEGLSDSLRNEVKPFGIDVIIIEPGGIKTEWGGIAHESLLKISGETAYSTVSQKFSNGFINTNRKNSPPIVIGKLIKKAIEQKRPRARYSAGYLAKPTLFLRKLLSDRMFDKMIMNQLNKLGKPNAKA